MRKLLLFLSLLFGGAAAAQPLVCTEPGTVLEYAQYDESGRLTGYTRSTVLSCGPDSLGRTQVMTRSEALDTLRNPVMMEVNGLRQAVVTTERTEVRTSEMVTQLGAMFEELLTATLSSEEQRKLDFSVEGDEYTIPFALETKRRLPDLKFALRFAAEGRSLKMRIGVSDRQVLGRRRIETPAGVFEAVGLSEKVSFGFFVIRVSMRQQTWYVPGLGVVREEEQTRSGKTEGWSELVSVTRP